MTASPGTMQTALAPAKIVRVDGVEQTYHVGGPAQAVSTSPPAEQELVDAGTFTDEHDRHFLVREGSPPPSSVGFKLLDSFSRCPAAYALEHIDGIEPLERTMILKAAKPEKPGKPATKTKEATPAIPAIPAVTEGAWQKRDDAANTAIILQASVGRNNPFELNRAIETANGNVQDGIRSALEWSESHTALTAPPSQLTRRTLIVQPTDGSPSLYARTPQVIGNPDGSVSFVKLAFGAYKGDEDRTASFGWTDEEKEAGEIDMTVPEPDLNPSLGSSDVTALRELALAASIFETVIGRKVADMTVLYPKDQQKVSVSLDSPAGVHVMRSALQFVDAESSRLEEAHATGMFEARASDGKCSRCDFASSCEFAAA
jgi:hypothetical protein